MGPLGRSGSTRSFAGTIAVLLAAAITLTQPGPASACSCTPWNPEDLLTYPSLIFTGRAIKAHVEPDPLPPEARTEPRYDYRIRTTFEAQTVWKGYVGGPITIESRSNSAACGIQFTVGEVYTVVAGGTDASGYGTSSCAMFLPDNVEAILESYRSRRQAFDGDVVRNPADVEALRRKIGFLIEYQDFSSAVPLLDRALDLAPDDADLRLVRAQALFQLEQYGQALIAFEHVLAGHRSDLAARRGLRSTLLKLRRFDDERVARDFSGLELDPSSFSGWELAGATFRAATLGSADFNHAVLARADMREAYLWSASFVGADLTKADLSAAYLDDADLRGADLTLSNLRDTALFNANLTGASLVGADLTAANLGGANLAGVDFGDATLLGASLQAADLRGADLSRTNLLHVRLDRMTYDCQTRWPAGFDPIAHGGKPPTEKCPSDLPDAVAAPAPQTLRRVDLSHLSLSGLSFAGMDLSGANFSGAALDGVDFSGADLTGADLRGATVTDSLFLRSDLSRADFTGATIRRSLKHPGELQLSFQGAILENATFREAILRNLDFAGARLSGAVLADASITDVNFASTGDLPDADLSQANFRGAYLERTTFSSRQLRAATMTGATTLCGDSSDADVRELMDNGVIAKPRPPVRCPAPSQANLNFRGADLRNADLAAADLGNADLRDADLRGAYLGGWYFPDGSSNPAAVLSGADLSGARLRGARYDEKTVWPAGFDARAAGMVYARVAVGYDPTSLTSAWAPSADGPPIFELAAIPDVPVPDFPGEDLSGLDLTAAWLPGSRLDGASLAGNRLMGANLSGASLAGADLAGANLSGAILKGADLSRASLRDANLRGADLRRANLAGADLRDVRYNRSTKWPVGFDPIAEGARKPDY